VPSGDGSRAGPTFIGLFPPLPVAVGAATASIVAANSAGMANPASGFDAELSRSGTEPRASTATAAGLAACRGQRRRPSGPRATSGSSPP